MIEMFGNQCVNKMNNILTFHFTDYSLKQKIAEPLFFHMDRDFNNQNKTYTKKCQTQLPIKITDSNKDAKSWKRCWYEK